MLVLFCIEICGILQIVLKNVITVDEDSLKTLNAFLVICNRILKIVTNGPDNLTCRLPLQIFMICNDFQSFDCYLNCVKGIVV